MRASASSCSPSSRSPHSHRAARSTSPPSAVADQGGYVGGGFAWLLATLTGELIAGVLLVGLLVAGLVVTGLSISALVDLLRDRFEPAQEAADCVRPGANVAAKTAPLLGARRSPTLPMTGHADTGAPRRAKREQRTPRGPDARPSRSPRPSPRERWRASSCRRSRVLSKTSESAAKHKASDNELRATGNVIADTLGDVRHPCARRRLDRRTHRHAVRGRDRQGRAPEQDHRARR